MLRIYCMQSDDFKMLFPRSMREEIEKAEDDGIRTGLISSIPVFYRGELPETKGVLLLSSVTTERVIRDMYVSALEAAISGEEIISIGDNGGMLSVIRGAEDGDGRIHMVISEGMRDYERKHGWKLRKILLTGGSIISPCLTGRSGPESREIALALSSSMIAAASGNRLRSIHLIPSALDMGLDVSVLRSSLTEKAMRNIVMEGCPVVDTYSSSVRFPRAIAYLHSSGSYGFRGSVFDIMRMQWD